MKSCRMLMIAVLMVVAAPVALGAAALQDYERPGQLEAPPDGMASLYRAPWRSNVRTASAYEALQGVGVYYKHVPAWSIEQNTHVMKEMAACGVKRLRLAPHWAMCVNTEWTAPQEKELQVLLSEMTACRNAGIRRCVAFVHLPPFAGRD